MSPRNFLSFLQSGIRFAIIAFGVFGPASPSNALPGSDAASEQEAEPGIFYRNDRFPEVPWSIHVVKVERNHREFDFVTTKAKDTVLGLSTLTEQIKSIPPDAGTPTVAINGDFYKTERERYPGDPRGLLIIRGEVVSSPIDRACMWLDAEGNPRI